jgi:hypothetical protein
MKFSVIRGFKVNSVKNISDISIPILGYSCAEIANILHFLTHNNINRIAVFPGDSHQAIWPDTFQVNANLFQIDLYQNPEHKYVSVSAVDKSA